MSWILIFNTIKVIAESYSNMRDNDKTKVREWGNKNTQKKIRETH